MLSEALEQALERVANSIAAQSKVVVFPARPGMSWEEVRRERKAATACLARTVRRLTAGERTVYQWADRPILGSPSPLIRVLSAVPDPDRPRDWRGSVSERPGDICYNLWLIGGSMQLQQSEMRR